MSHSPEPSSAAARATGIALLSACGLVLLAQLHLVLLLNVNWDEFYYLSLVHQHARGELAARWMTFHVHLYDWLRAVPGHELEQVTAARLVAWLLHVATSILLYRVARRCLGVAGSAAAVLAFVTFSYVMVHGASFRPDPACTMLFMAALDLALAPRRSAWSAVLAGALMGVSLVISLKAALHVGALLGALALGVAVSPPPQRRMQAGRIATLLAVAALLGLALGAWHARSLAPAAAAGQQASTFLPRLAGMMFGSGTPFPQRHFLLVALRENPVTWAALAAGLVTCVVRAARDRSARPLLPVVLALPLLSLAVYRNAYPYFYVDVLAPAAVLAGVPLDAALRPGRSRAPRLLGALLAGGLLLGGLTKYLANLADQRVLQRQVLDLVHRIHPEPVPYLDRCSMVASFPKVGFFMSTLGLRLYREQGEPVMERLIAERRPLFLVVNVPALQAPWAAAPDPADPRRLLPADEAALRENFIPHWGPVHVAGKRFDPGGMAGLASFDVLVPGPYTVEAEVPVLIDGVLALPGDVPVLEAGCHALGVPHPQETIVLRWGRHAWRPDFEPARQPLFTGL